MRRRRWGREGGAAAGAGREVGAVPGAGIEVGAAPGVGREGGASAWRPRLRKEEDGGVSISRLTGGSARWAHKTSGCGDLAGLQSTSHNKLSLRIVGTTFWHEYALALPSSSVRWI